MRTIFIFLLIGLTIVTFAQKDTIIYLGVNGKILSNKEEAKKYQELEIIDEDNYKLYYYSKVDDKWEKKGCQQISRISNSKYKLGWVNGSNSETIIREVKDTNGIFLVTDYYSKKSISQIGLSKHIFPLHKVNTWKEYYRNGKKKSEEYYADNQLTGNLRWNERGEKDISNVFPEADIMPLYGGVDNYDEFRRNVVSKMRYPHEASEKGIQGKVLAEIIILEDGNLADIKVIKGSHPLLNEEAIRVLKSMSLKWTPGYIDNKPVRVKWSIPLIWKLH